MAHAPTPDSCSRRIRRPSACAARCGSPTSRCTAPRSRAPRSPSCCSRGIVWKVVDLARPAISTFGLGFITEQSWNPVVNRYGAWDFLVGSLVSSIGALLIAGPLAVGIAIYLTELSPRWVRQPLAILVELLAAIPSVVLGLWGILVLGPFVNIHLEPFLQRVLGWIPFFSGDAVARRHAAGDPDPRADDAAHHHEHLARGAPDGAARHARRRARARRDPLGDDPRDRAALRAARDRRSDDARARPRPRRGDRRDAGDRQRDRRPVVQAVRARRTRSAAASRASTRARRATCRELRSPTSR